MPTLLERTRRNSVQIINLKQVWIHYRVIKVVNKQNLGKCVRALNNNFLWNRKKVEVKSKLQVYSLKSLKSSTHNRFHILECVQHLSSHWSMSRGIPYWLHGLQYILTNSHGLHCSYSHYIKTMHRSALKVQRNRFTQHQICPPAMSKKTK